VCTLSTVLVSFLRVSLRTFQLPSQPRDGETGSYTVPTQSSAGGLG